MSFNQFNLSASIMEAIEYLNYKQPTPIQEMSIPKILENKDIIACAQTGTGKTAAFLLPILHKITSEDTHNLNTLILVPTRELAIQIDQILDGISYFSSVSSYLIIGGGDGQAFEREKKALKKGGADIVIATPGRLISHLTSGYAFLEDLKHFVLDEADKMLDMGFYDDILKIFRYLPEEKEVILFSATMPPKMRSLASKLMKEPEYLNIAVSQPAEKIKQSAYVVYEEQKIPLLMNIMEDASIQSAIIFCSTKQNVKILEKNLQKLKLQAKGIHSDLEQHEREQIFQSFKNHQLKVLIGTDIISRGIDVENVSLVINFDIPGDAEDYIHRIGRTARAESKGAAISFINETDQRKFNRIERFLQKEIDKESLPSELGEGPVYKVPERSSNNKRKFSGKGKKRFNKPRKSS